jgi:hypothetical protein
MQLSLFHSDQNGPNSAKKLYWKVRTGNIRHPSIFDRIRAYNDKETAQKKLQEHLADDPDNVGSIYQEHLKSDFEL